MRYILGEVVGDGSGASARWAAVAFYWEVDVDDGSGLETKLWMFIVSTKKAVYARVQHTFWKVAMVSSKSAVAKKWLSRWGLGT